MLDPKTGNWLPNFYCRSCRFRHPIEWTCEKSQEVSAQQSATLSKMVDVELLLSAVLSGWQQNHSLPPQSADEQISRKGLAILQKEWLHTFSKLWDLTQQTENYDGR
jgi:hypothetical protein